MYIMLFIGWGSNWKLTRSDYLLFSGQHISPCLLPTVYPVNSGGWGLGLVYGKVSVVSKAGCGKRHAQNRWEKIYLAEKDWEIFQTES